MKLRELVESFVGQDVDVMEARLWLFLWNMKNREFDDVDRRQAASQSGRFWLPCFHCTEWHGGNEPMGTSVRMSESYGIGVCANCSSESERINRRWPNGIQTAEGKPLTSTTDASDK